VSIAAEAFDFEIEVLPFAGIDKHESLDEATERRGARRSR
jgi:hypothetical protein